MYQLFELIVCTSYIVLVVYTSYVVVLCTRCMYYLYLLVICLCTSYMY